MQLNPKVLSLWNCWRARASLLYALLHSGNQLAPSAEDDRRRTYLTLIILRESLRIKRTGNHTTSINSLHLSLHLARNNIIRKRGERLVTCLRRGMSFQDDDDMRHRFIILKMNSPAILRMRSRKIDFPHQPGKKKEGGGSYQLHPEVIQNPPQSSSWGETHSTRPQAKQAKPSISPTGEAG